MKTYIDNATDNIVTVGFNNITRYTKNVWKKSALILDVSDLPKFKYHHVDNFLLAKCEKTGFLNAFEIKKGTTIGFAGREITLDVIGGKIFKAKGTTKRTFKGDLWSSEDAYKKLKEYFNLDIVGVGVKKRWAKIDVYSSCMIDKTVIVEKLKRGGISWEHIQA